MATLTKKEIMAELKRLGIYSNNELEDCLEEYEEYCGEGNGRVLCGKA